MSEISVNAKQLLTLAHLLQCFTPEGRRDGTDPYLGLWDTASGALGVSIEYASLNEPKTAEEEAQSSLVVYVDEGGQLFGVDTQTFDDYRIAAVHLDNELPTGFRYAGALVSVHRLDPQDGEGAKRSWVEG